MSWHEWVITKDVPNLLTWPRKETKKLNKGKCRVQPKIISATGKKYIKFLFLFFVFSCWTFMLSVRFKYKEKKYTHTTTTTKKKNETVNG